MSQASVWAMVLVLQILAFVLFLVAGFGLAPALRTHTYFSPSLIAFGLASWVLSTFVGQIG